MNIWEHALREVTKKYFPLEWDDASELFATKKTNYPSSFTLKNEEYRKLLSAAQKGKGTLRIVSAIDEKPIAVLDSKDIEASLLKMKPTIQLIEGGEYWVCNIPTSAFSKAKGVKTAIPKPPMMGVPGGT